MSIAGPVHHFDIHLKAALVESCNNELRMHHTKLNLFQGSVEYMRMNSRCALEQRDAILCFACSLTDPGFELSIPEL